MRAYILLALFLLLTKGLCDDFEVFCELVSLSPSKANWCSDCLDPCENDCGVDCNADNTSIIGINATSKKLKSLPESIGSLTSLVYLK